MICILLPEGSGIELGTVLVGVVVGWGEWCGSGWASWGVRHEVSGARREVVWWWVGVWCVVVGG